MDTPTASLADAPPVGEDRLHEQRLPLMRQAETRYSGAGWEVYQLWRDYNERLFGRQMEHCPIQFAPVSGNRFGLWQDEEPSITLGSELLHRDGKVWHLHHEQLGPRFPADVLLRQMTFQYLETIRDTETTDQTGAPVEPLSENEWWLKEISRLTEEIGLEQPTFSEGRNWWPYSVRPEGYYNADWAAIVARER